MNETLSVHSSHGPGTQGAFRSDGASQCGPYTASGAQGPCDCHTGQHGSTRSVLRSGLLYLVLELGTQVQYPGNKLHLFGRLCWEEGWLEPPVPAHNTAQGVGRGKWAEAGPRAWPVYQLDSWGRRGQGGGVGGVGLKAQPTCGLRGPQCGHRQSSDRPRAHSSCVPSHSNCICQNAV